MNFVFYSNYSKKSLLFKELCNRNAKLDNKYHFEYVCIDYNQDKQRPDRLLLIQDKYDFILNVVPAVVIANEYFLEGKEAFEWLQDAIQNIDESAIKTISEKTKLNDDEYTLAQRRREESDKLIKELVVRNERKFEEFVGLGRNDN